MSSVCTCCWSDIHHHDPVFVEELRNGERDHAGQFCNYACLTAHVDEQELAVDSYCKVDR